MKQILLYMKKNVVGMPENSGRNLNGEGADLHEQPRAPFNR